MSNVKAQISNEAQDPKILDIESLVIDLIPPKRETLKFGINRLF